MAKRVILELEVKYKNVLLSVYQINKWSNRQRNRRTGYNF